MRRILLVALLLLAAPSAAEAQAVRGRDGPERRRSRSTTPAPSTSAGRSTPTTPATPSSSASSRPAARRCGSQVTIPFPGQGYNRSRVSVLLPAPNVVDVIVPRTNGARRALLPRALARRRPHLRPRGRASPASGSPRRSRAPAARVALGRRPDHDARRPVRPRRLERRDRGQHRSAPSSKACSPTSPRRARRCSRPAPTRASSHAFRLGAGGDPNNPAAWQQIDPARGRQPELAGLPGGFAVDARADRRRRQPVRAAPRGRGVVAARRAHRRRSTTTASQLASNAKGRLTAVRHLLRLPPRLHDLDRRRRPVVLDRQHRELRRSTRPASRSPPTRRARASPPSPTRSAPRPSASRASRRAPRPSRAGASAACACRSAASVTTTSSSRSSSRPRAATAGSRRRRVLRRASFGRARGARRGFRSRFRARYDAAPPHRAIPVRVIPRRGKARTLRLRVRRCGATR